MALLGSSPLRMESVSISTRASAWKCAGLWSLKYIRTTIPKNRVTSGISSLDSTFSARPAPGNLRRPHRPGGAASPAPRGPRLRCDCAVTSAVCGGVSDHRGIPTGLRTQPLRPIWTGLNWQPSGSTPVSATIFSITYRHRAKMRAYELRSGVVAIVPHVRIVVLQQRGAKRINLRKPSGPPPERTPRDGSSFDARAHRAVDHSAAPRIRLAGLESRPQRDRRNVEDSVRERNVRDKETPGLTQFQVAHELPNRPGVIGQNAGDCGVYRGRDFVNFGRRVWVYRHTTGLLILGFHFWFRSVNP